MEENKKFDQEKLETKELAPRVKETSRKILKKSKEKEKKRKGDKNRKTIPGKIWHFLWHDNSIWSWIVDLIIVFLIVKFVFFPLMTLATGSLVPLVVIESNSMEHNGRIENWWFTHNSWYEQNGVSLDKFEEWSFKNGMNRGDMILVFARTEYNKGNVIVFDGGEEKPIIHRIVIINEDKTYQTKGDNNLGQNPDYEKRIEKEQIFGKAILRIPYVGWVKLFFTQILFGVK